MGFVKEFKEFAMKGNVVDLAVGVIIGGAFGKIVTSMVDDLIMPLVGLATGGTSFVNKYVGLAEGSKAAQLAGMSLEEAKTKGAVFAYGNFIQNVINFIILALCIFMMVRAMNNLRKKEETTPAAAPAPTATETLLIEIRDELKKRP